MLRNVMVTFSQNKDTKENYICHHKQIYGVTIHQQGLYLPIHSKQGIFCRGMETALYSNLK